MTHLRSYLANEDEVQNVLLFHQKTLTDLIHVQLEQHFEERAAGYEATVSRGFTTLRAASFSLPAGESVRNFREPVEPGCDIRGLLFGDFTKCVYLAQRFQSAPEWRFAALRESELDVLQWVKPAPGQFQIRYRGDRSYEPDFVVETATEKLLCEPKAAGELEDPEVQDKARAARLCCQRATEHARRHDGKVWRYLLIPHHAIEANRTLTALAAEFEFTLAVRSPR